jgi:hypothetical protein
MTDFVRSANAHPDHDDGLSLVVRPFVARGDDLYRRLEADRFPDSRNQRAVTRCAQFLTVRNSDSFGIYKRLHTQCVQIVGTVKEYKRRFEALWRFTRASGDTF